MKGFEYHAKRVKRICFEPDSLFSDGEDHVTAMAYEAEPRSCAKDMVLSAVEFPSAQKYHRSGDRCKPGGKVLKGTAQVNLLQVDILYLTRYFSYVIHAEYSLFDYPFYQVRDRRNHPAVALLGKRSEVPVQESSPPPRTHSL